VTIYDYLKVEKHKNNIEKTWKHVKMALWAANDTGKLHMRIEDVITNLAILVL
jgi:hypothetical protein